MFLRDPRVSLTPVDLQTICTALRCALNVGAQQPQALVQVMCDEETDGIVRGLDELMAAIQDLLVRTRLEMALRILADEGPYGDSGG